MEMNEDLKVVLVLWDGVRFDAVGRVGAWVGLPNMHRLIREGVFYTNVFGISPALTPAAVGRIVKNGENKWISTMLHEKSKGQIKSCFVGYPEDGLFGEPKHIPNCNFLNNVTYDKKEEWRKLHGTPTEKASIKFHRVQYPDKLRMDIGCKMIPKHNFTFIYFVEPDDSGHICRDNRKWIYHRGSPYIRAIKNCDNLMYHIIQTLEWCAKDNYILIIVADPGMTDEGRHALSQWNDERVSRVPLVIYGKGIRKGRVENTLYRTDNISKGIIGLFSGAGKDTIFQCAMEG